MRMSGKTINLSFVVDEVTNENIEKLAKRLHGTKTDVMRKAFALLQYALEHRHIEEKEIQLLEGA